MKNILKSCTNRKDCSLPNSGIVWFMRTVYDQIRVHQPMLRFLELWELPQLHNGKSTIVVPCSQGPTMHNHCWSLASRSREGILLLCCGETSSGVASSSEALSTRTWTCWIGSRGGQQKWSEGWSTSPTRTGWESWSCSAWRREGCGETYCSLSVIKGALQERRGQSF